MIISIFFRIFVSLISKNMPFWSHKIIISFILLWAGGILCAQKNDEETKEALRLSGGSISTAVPFLVISPDARSGAMGDAGVASSPDINSQHWNAAKYPFIEDKYGVSLTYSPWLRVLVSDMDLLYLSGHYRLDDNNAFGASLRFFSLGKIHFRESSDDFGATYNPNEYAVDVSYSRRLSEYFSIGITARYIRSDLTSGYSSNSGTKSSAANSAAADVSMFYTRSIMTPGTEESSFALGLNISNIGAKVSYSESMAKDFLPANIRFGGSYTVQLDRYNELSAMVDFNKLLVPTPPIRRNDSIIAGMDPDIGIIPAMFQSFHDAPGGFREELQEVNISVGLEYWYNKTFAFRGGHFFEHKNKGGRRRRRARLAADV